VFGHLLGLGSFNSLEGLLAHKQVSLPITFSGVEHILTSTIALIGYLGSWTFIISVMAVRFMDDQRLFLLET
jgi:hypothetical protein